MEERSFADVKAHLSEIVDQAEHSGKRIIILRHGKAAAAVVPVRVARGQHRVRTMAPADAEARLLQLARELAGEDGFGAVADLLEGRR